MSDYLAIASASCARVLRDHKVTGLTLAERELCAGALVALTARVAQLEAEADEQDKSHDHAAFQQLRADLSAPRRRIPTSTPAGEGTAT